jgi:antitoxin FitA
MANVLIRDLPEETHRELLRKAEEHGQSLQQYLTSELTRLATSPTLDEVLRRVDGRRGGRVGLEQAAADIAAERSRA